MVVALLLHSRILSILHVSVLCFLFLHQAGDHQVGFGATLLWLHVDNLLRVFRAHWHHRIRGVLPVLLPHLWSHQGGLSVGMGRLTEMRVPSARIVRILTMVLARSNWQLCMWEAFGALATPKTTSWGRAPSCPQPPWVALVYIHARRPQHYVGVAMSPSGDIRAR